jgi:SPP1 family predicted phage head-tail adaptor
MASKRIGARDTPIALGRPVVTRDNAGGEVLTWEEFKTWAGIQPLTGREVASAGLVKESVDYKILIKPSPGWEPSERWRVRDRVTGTLYNLVAILSSPRSGTAECLAKRASGNSDAR